MKRHSRTGVLSEQLSLFDRPLLTAQRPRQRRPPPIDPPHTATQRRAGLLRLIQRVRAAADPAAEHAALTDETLVDIALATTQLRIGDIRLTLPRSWRQEPTLTNQ